MKLPSNWTLLLDHQLISVPFVYNRPDGIGRRSPRDLPCHVHDPDLWFAEQSAQVERAKLLCAGCPVRSGCLAGALQRGEPCGVWGGEILVQGRVVPFKRGRGRPRTRFAEVRDVDLPRVSA